MVIPALDEESSLPRVLEAIPEAFRSRVLVVDNGSRDGTARVARDAGARVIEEPRRGYGAACLAGLAALAQDPPEVVVFLDGDFSDDPSELPRVAAPALAGEADLVVGSRVLGRREPGALPPHARMGNALAAGLIRLLYGVRITDLGPFRALRWEALERLGMEDRDYGWTVQMQVRGARSGLRMIEVPVSYRRRIGRSKISGTIGGSFRAGYKILSVIFREYIRRPLSPPSVLG